MKKIVTLAVAMLAFSAVAALAIGPGPFFARGGYYDGGWSADAGNQMTLAAGIWTVAATSPMAAGYYEGKVATSDWLESYPASNQPIFISGPGDVVTWSFDTNTYADGWLPATGIAYNDHAVASGMTFEVIGAAPETGSWGSGVAAVLNGDVWEVTIPIGTPGTYDVKFRKTGDWSINVGSDGYGTNANNASYTTTIANEPMLFQFNQRTGRMRISTVGATPTRSTTFGGLKAEYR